LSKKVRVFIEGLPHYIYMSSLKDIEIFKDDEDIGFFLENIKDLSKVCKLDIHSYVLEKFAFRLIVTPYKQNSIAKFMQSLGRRYVRYYNQKYHRSGTLWNGRYKLFLIQETYLFDMMIYIESLKKDVLVNSLKIHLKGKSDGVISFHKKYKNLDVRDKGRVEQYLALFKKGVVEKKRDFIESCLKKQMIIGSNEFIKNLEQKLGRILFVKNRGRPKKNQNKGKKMYKNLVVLDKEKHKSLKVKPMKDLMFAKDLAFVPVMASEVELVGKTFPVVFTADENPMLIALISLGGENLAINENGKWIAEYVPLFLRKYPFSVASTQENPKQKIILIDEDSDLVSKREGKALFTKDGKNSEVLDRAISFLDTYEQNNTVTKNVVNLIKDSDILEDREITVGEGEESKTLVEGFKVVNKEKLNELSDDVLADWVRKGIISMIDAHLKSLENIDTLFKLAMQKQNIK